MPGVRGQRVGRCLVTSRSWARRLGAVGLLAAVVTACGGCAAGAASYTGPSPLPSALQVVTTTTLLADMVRQVGGRNVSVTSLVPKGGDVHTFDPRPSEAWSLSGARLVIANGLGLDNWLTQLAADVGTDGPVVHLGENLPGVAYIVEGGQTNPHLWLDVANAELYVDRIQAALAAADPAHAADYRAGRDAYRARLADLDSWARGQLAALPAANRRIVSYHDALPYFCRAYGLTVVGNVVAAPGQDPSAKEIQALIDAMRSNGVRAIFSEAQFSPELARTIAAEAGATVVSDLYTDTLGDSPVDTYEGVVRWDVGHIVEALR
jgi:ABC-type Zn uptake system ZnuABC Zn-binding protein ZnuA